MTNQELIRANIQSIQHQIQQVSSQRNPQTEVQLVAVTKTVSPSIMRILFENGIHHFGENRSNVLIEKQEALADLKQQIKWHFIGRLQSRQVKTIINQIDYLHSLDRLSLAKEIQKRALHPIKCYVQVNVSGEESKAGFEPEQLEDTIAQLAQYDKIKVVGLMTMAPYDASETELHRQFAQLKTLQENIMTQHHPHAPCTEISMGMSGDFKVAIQEGASVVRIGSAFFEGIILD